MTLIIGISGKKGSGKSSLGESLLKPQFCAANPRLYVRLYSFADGLKRFCHDFLGIQLEWLYGNDTVKNKKIGYILWENMPGYNPCGLISDKYGPMTVREILQWVGTEVIRRMNPNAHVDNCFRQIRKDGVDVAVITDCRFRGEATAIEQENGYVVRLTRNVAGTDTHSSETDLDQYKFDHVIDNASMTLGESVETFQKYVLSLLKSN